MAQRRSVTYINGILGFFCLSSFLLTPIILSAKQEDAYRLETEVGWVDLGGPGERLRENHFGDRWKKRLNLQIALSSRTTMNEHVTFFLEPVVMNPRKGNDVFLRRGYVYLVYANTALKVGRESLWWGPGRHGSLILSNNAFPFDLIQLGSDLPFRLPGPLSDLGTFEVTGFLTELEGARKSVARPRVLGLRISYHPSKRITLSASRVTIFGGEGRPGVNLKDFLNIYFGVPNRGGEFEVNEIGGFDHRFHLPLNQGHHLALYAEAAGEDEAGYLPTNWAILTGIVWTFGEQMLMVEYADNNIDGDGRVWYVHPFYQYRYRGEIMGHHMGTDANDFFVRTSSPLSEKWFIGLDFEKERHGLSKPIKGKFTRWGGDIAYLHTPQPTYSFRYQFERIKNPDRPPNNGRNHYGIVSVVWRFQ